MNSFTRGVKNALRNPLRSGAVVIILGLGIGLSLAMLVAQQSVADRIEQLKTTIAPTVTVNPAGARGFEGGGEPLTADTVTKVKAVADISNVYESVGLRLRNSSASTNSFQPPQDSTSTAKTTGDTSLNSAIDAGTLGLRNNSSTTTDAVPRAFSLPITATGVSGSVNSSGQALTLTAGRALSDSDANAYVAVVGKSLADKNSLSVGSTFTAYDQTFTVVGIFNAATTFENAQLYVPISTAQTLSGQTDQFSQLVVQVDSLENVTAATAALKTALGNAADVTSSQDNIQTAVDSLASVKTVSFIGFIASLIAAGVIIFLVMLVVVRERRREIGVLKAIGAGNFSIIKQFMTEALVLITLGALVGVGMAYVSSGSIANALVSSNTTSSSSQTSAAPQGFGGRRGGFTGGPAARLGNVNSGQQLVGKVAASLGLATLLSGLGAAFLIAIIGSAIPAYMTAKIRPSEIMRGE